jgi:hypothetical protein
MTAAQKTAKANFKKAIEYRKKTGVSLKEAFAHVYGKKVGAAPKKKATKKAAPKKAAKKIVKKVAPKKVYGTKKRKPIKEQSILNKIHKVKDQVSQLDELQHKHMSGLPKYRNAVRVYFKNPKYNYTTSIGPYATEESAKQYFLGQYFNVGVYPKEILQKPIRIRFFKYLDK